MPELNKNFTKGRMNKDLDERLVPSGEYRDALNVQVATSEGSDVGSLQNLLSNTQLTSWLTGSGSSNAWFSSVPTASKFSNHDIMSNSHDEAECVGVLQDDENNKVFCFISSANSTYVDDDPYEDTTAAVASVITIPSNGLFNGLNRRVGVKSDIIFEFDFDNFDTNKAIKPIITDVYESRHAARPIYDATLNTVKMPMEAPIVYDPNNAAAFPQSQGADDFNKITGLSTVTYYKPNGAIGYRPAGIRAGMRVRNLLPNGVDLWGGSEVYVTKVLPSSSVDDGHVEIAGLKQNSIASNLVLPVYNKDHINDGAVLVFTAPKVLQFQSSSRERESTYDEFGNITIGNSSPTPNGNIITGINRVDDLLFWTDGISEPRKINIERFKSASKGFLDHTILNIEERINDGSFYVKEEHTTAIKRNPKKAPKILSSVSREAENDTNITVSNADSGVLTHTLMQNYYYQPITTSLVRKRMSASGPNAGASIDFNLVGYTEGNVLYVNAEIERVYWKYGDTLELSDNLGGVAKFRVDGTWAGTGPQANTFTAFRLTFLNFVGDYSDNSPDAVWTARLFTKEALYKNQFISFAMRYKYVDNEYSCISPYSEPVFIPGGFSMSASTGFNSGMENRTQAVTVYDYISSDLPDDVVEVELLYRDSDSFPAVYHAASVSPDNPHWELKQNINSTSPDKGLSTFEEEVFGAILPTSQLDRVWDALPKKAEAQEFVSSRIMYGNYYENYNLVDDSGSKVSGNILLSVETVPNPTVSIAYDVNTNLCDVRVPFEYGFMRTGVNLSSYTIPGNGNVNYGGGYNAPFIQSSTARWLDNAAIHTNSALTEDYLYPIDSTYHIGSYHTANPNNVLGSEIPEANGVISGGELPKLIPISLSNEIYDYGQQYTSDTDETPNFYYEAASTGQYSFELSGVWKALNMQGFQQAPLMHCIRRIDDLDNHSIDTTYSWPGTPQNNDPALIFPSPGTYPVDWHHIGNEGERPVQPYFLPVYRPAHGAIQLHFVDGEGKPFVPAGRTSSLVPQASGNGINGMCSTDPINPTMLNLDGSNWGGSLQDLSNGNDPSSLSATTFAFEVANKFKERDFANGMNHSIFNHWRKNYNYGNDIPNDTFFHAQDIVAASCNKAYQRIPLFLSVSKDYGAIGFTPDQDLNPDAFGVSAQAMMWAAHGGTIDLSSVNFNVSGQTGSDSFTNWGTENHYPADGNQFPSDDGRTVEKLVLGVGSNWDTCLLLSAQPWFTNYVMSPGHWMENTYQGASTGLNKYCYAELNVDVDLNIGERVGLFYRAWDFEDDLGAGYTYDFLEKHPTERQGIFRRSLPVQEEFEVNVSWAQGASTITADPANNSATVNAKLTDMQSASGSYGQNGFCPDRQDLGNPNKRWARLIGGGLKSILIMDYDSTTGVMNVNYPAGIPNDAFTGTVKLCLLERKFIEIDYHPIYNGNKLIGDRYTGTGNGYGFNINQYYDTCDYIDNVAYFGDPETNINMFTSNSFSSRSNDIDAGDVANGIAAPIDILGKWRMLGANSTFIAKYDSAINKTNQVIALGGIKGFNVLIPEAFSQYGLESHGRSYMPNLIDNEGKAPVGWDYMGDNLDLSRTISPASYHLAFYPAAGYSNKGTKFKVTAAPASVEDVVIRQGNKSVKSERGYEVGVVYCDKYGRESTVLIDSDGDYSSSKNIAKNYSSTKNKLITKILNKAPEWADHYKFFLKETAPEYYNISLHKAYDNNDSGAFAWLSFNSADKDKIKEGDYLSLKKAHGTNDAIDSLEAKWKVLSRNNDVPQGADGELIDALDTNNPAIAGNDASSKFFIKIEADQAFRDLLDVSGSIFDPPQANANPLLQDDLASKNGAIFEVLPDYKVTVKNDETKAEFGIFYEISNGIPIKLDVKNAPQYINYGTKISIHENSTAPIYEQNNAGVIDTWNSANTNLTVADINGATSFKKGYHSTGAWTWVWGSVGAQAFYPVIDEINFCKVYLNNPISGDFYFTDNSGPTNEIYIQFEDKDGNYVTAALAKDIKDGDTYICLKPYTTSFNGYSINTSVKHSWYNCISFGNGVESDRIRDDFNEKTLQPYTSIGKQSGFKASKFFDDYKEEHRPYDITYSQLYNERAGIDQTNQFIIADKITKRLNPDYGKIKKLHARNAIGSRDDVVALCENKIVKILSSGKNALFNADGNSQLLSSTAVLGQTIPFGADFGCQNPESFAADQYRIYFVDKSKGAVLRLSRDGITTISDAGMDDWFHDNLNTEANNSIVGVTRGIIGSYDDSKSEYNITIHNVLNANSIKRVYTLSYHEPTDGWVSFKSFIPEAGFSINNKYFTFKKGEIWDHSNWDASTYNNFYGTAYESSVTVLFNEIPGAVKAFRTLAYEGTQAKIQQSLTDGEYYNNAAQNGWYINSITTDKQEGEVPEFIEKEGKWFNYIHGEATSYTNAVDGGSTSNNLDFSEFSVQGLGNLASVNVDSGSTPTTGYSVSVNLTGLSNMSQSLNNSFSTSLINLTTTPTASYTAAIEISPNNGFSLAAASFNVLNLANVTINNSSGVSVSPFSGNQDITFTDSGVPNTPTNTVLVNITLSNAITISSDQTLSIPVNGTAIGGNLIYETIVRINHGLFAGSPTYSWNLPINLTQQLVVQSNNLLGYDEFLITGLGNTSTNMSIFNLVVSPPSGYGFNGGPNISFASTAFPQNYTSQLQNLGGNSPVNIIDVNYTMGTTSEEVGGINDNLIEIDLDLQLYQLFFNQSGIVVNNTNI